MSNVTDKPVNDFGEGLAIGSQHYRAWVGPPEQYDLIAATQFNLITTLGLREYHTYLDVGCGSLRGGRLAIMYLRPGHYFGIEPTAWALEEGKKAHLGEELIRMKKPTFSNDGNFTLTVFNRKFDFVLVHSVFTHAAGRQIARCLEEAGKVMEPTSIFVATFLEANKNYEGDEWVYPRVTKYTKEFITNTVESAGLECTHVDWPHPFNQKWFIATDPSNNLDVPKLTSGFNFSYTAYLQNRIEYYAQEKLKEGENVFHPSYIAYLQSQLVHYSGQTDFPSF